MHTIGITINTSAIYLYNQPGSCCFCCLEVYVLCQGRSYISQNVNSSLCAFTWQWTLFNFRTINQTHFHDNNKLMLHKTWQIEDVCPHKQYFYIIYLCFTFDDVWINQCGCVDHSIWNHSSYHRLTDLSFMCTQRIYVHKKKICQRT